MLLFRVGPTTYAADIASAQEIIPLRPTTRLPGAPACVRGLINVRGTIATVLDLRVRLDPACGPLTEGSILLLRRGNGYVGVVVDEVADVRPVAVERVDGADQPGSIVRGIGHADEASVVVLDLDALIKQVLLS